MAQRWSDWYRNNGGSAATGGASTSTYRKKRKDEDEGRTQSWSEWQNQNPNRGEELRQQRQQQNELRQQQRDDRYQRALASNSQIQARHAMTKMRSAPIDNLIQWSRNVQVSDVNTAGDLASQAKDLQRLFSENKDMYDRRTLNQVQNILKTGEATLKKKDPSIGMNQQQLSRYASELQSQKAIAHNRRWNGSMMDNRTAENYDAEKDADEKLNALRRQNQELKRQQKLREYEQSAQGLDTTYRTTATGKERQVGYGGKITESGFDDPMYDLINKNKDAIFERQANASYADAYMGQDDDDLQQMTEEEVARFNALYTKDREQAYAYVEALRPDLRARQAEAEKQQWAERAEKYPILTSALSVPNNLMSSMVSLIGMGGAKLHGEEIDPNAGYMRGRRAQTAIRGTVGEMTGEALQNAILNTYEDDRIKSEVKKRFGSHIEKLGETTYGSVMSMLDNLFNVALVGGTPGAALTGFQEAASLTLMSTTAMPDTIVTAKEHGLSDRDAFGLGVIAGVAEYFTEKVSLDALFDMESIAKNGFLKYAGKAAFTEGSEEVASDFINFVAQEMIAGNNSDFNQMVKEYQKQGMSHEEAVKAAWSDQVEQAAMSFVGGAIAGGGAAVNLGTMNQIGQRRMADAGANIKAQNPDNAMIQRMGNEEVAQMASDQAQAARLEEIGETAKRQAADQIEAGEEVNPALIQALMQNQNALGVLEEQTGFEEIQTEEQLNNALREYVDNREQIETAQTMDEAYRMLDQAGTPVRSDYVSSRPALSAAVSEGTISNTFGEEGAKIYNDVANRAIESGLSPQQAYQEISQIYNAGNNRTNIKWSTNLPEADVAAVFKAGFQDAVKYAQNDAAKVSFASATGGTGVVENDLIRSLQSDPKTAKKINTMHRVAQALGLRVNYVEHIDGANGYFNQKTKEIYIAADAEEGAALAWVFGHEMTHRLQQVAPAEYNTLKQSVQTALGGRFNVEVQRELNKALREGAQMTQQEAQDEAVANFVGELVNDRGALDNFIKEHSGTKEGKSLLTKIRDFFRDLLNKISRAYGETVEVDPIQRTIDALNAAIEAGSKNVSNYQNELEKNGVTATEDFAVKYSLRTWNEKEIKSVKTALKKAGYTAEEIDNWIADVNGIAAMITADRTRLDYEADEYQVALKKNTEYYKTLDLSTLCKKRLLYQGTYNAIMHKLKDSVLAPEDTIMLRRMMDDLGYEVPCGICYEESRKKNEGIFAERWMNGYEKWKGYKNMEHSDPYIPTMDEVTTTDGRAKLRKEHPEALESYLKYQRTRGSANPKVSFTHTEYRGDIRKMVQQTIDNVKHIGGLRIQSFSDFETIHVIDMMQAVIDMASKHLTAQAYTKVPAFADIFGGTGIKINLSLIGQVNENGELVFDPKEGINPEEAFRIREKYSDNVGTILVGANNDSILAAWADPRIDMVIPFHRSGWSGDEFERLGLKGYDDFTDQQSERYLMDGKDISLDDANEILGLKGTDNELKGIYTDDYWDSSKTGKENAEAYLKLCAEKNYRPVFYKFLHDNGDGSWSLQEDGSTDGYWKSLTDYKMYNNEGVGAPQQEVRPNFDMEAAKETMDAYDGNPNTLPVAKDVVNKFVKQYKKNHAETAEGNIRYSRVSDKKVLNKLNNEETITVYRAMQVIDGKLYPPMAAREKNEAGKWQLKEPMELDTWYQSDESRREIDKNGKFVLDKANGSTVPAAYNPYWHASRSPLNDQFSSAYKRPNLVTVEAEVPVSELTSGYRAEGAKDTVGEMDWHSGPVSSKLAALGDRRQVILSRWVKLKRIIPDSEVASTIADMLNGKDIKVPANVVTPSLRSELDRYGLVEESKTRKSRRDLESSDLTISGNNARWTDERIDSLIRDYGASNPDYSQAYAVIMNPRDYLKLTLSDDMLEKWNEGSNDLNHPETYSLDEGRLRENTQTPFLSIYSNDGTEVQGHEGRHRMRALLEAGIKSVPVVIRDTDTKYTKTSMESMTLTAQDFGNGPVNNNAHVTVTDLVPIKSSNREELIRKFGGDASVRFSRKANLGKNGNLQTYTVRRNRTSVETDVSTTTVAKDTEERTLSKGQQEFFKNSKVRDENGNLKVMYHGTEKAGWTIFNPQESDDKLSLFFTDNLTTAKSYSGRRELYNLSKPNYEDLNGALEESGLDERLVKTKNGYELQDNGYTIDTFKTIRDAEQYMRENYWDVFRELGEDRINQGANYAVYLNITNPLVIDAAGDYWDSILDPDYARYGVKSHDRGDTFNIDGYSSAFTLDEITEKFGYGLTSQIEQWRDFAEDEDWDVRAALEMGAEFYTHNGEAYEPEMEGYPTEKDTRGWAEYAYRNGYNGIIFKNVRDNAANASGRERFEISTVAVAFNSNQVKSVDNLNPTEDEDIRYSRKDSEGRTLTDNQQEYFKDSQVRDAEGNLLVVYHGSPATDITVFDRERAGEHTGAYSDRAIWFTANEKFADDFSYEFKPTDSMFYVERGAKGRVYPGYLNIVNPFDLTNPTQEMKEILYRGASEIYKDAETKINELLDIGNHQLLKKYLDFDELEAAGYDGIIAKLDVKGNDLEYGIFNSNQAKDVANLNPTENEDIRKSRRSGETMTSLLDMAEANYRDERVHQEFMSAATKWRTNMTALSDFGKGGFNARMTDLVKTYRPDISDNDSEKLVREMRNLTREVARRPEMKYVEISDKANTIAAQILWGKEGSGMGYNESSAQAIDDIRNDMLAQMIGTVTRGEGKYRRLSKEFADYREKAQKNIKEVRDKRDAKIRKMKESNKRASESRKASALRDKIKRHISDLSDLLLKPTDKRHIPKNLQPTVAKLLESINLESVYRDKKGNVLTGAATKRTVAFQELQTIYAEMAKGGHMVIDPDLMGDDLTTGLFAEIIAMKNTSIMAMNSEQLNKIWKAVRAMENAVRTANRLFAQYRYENVSQIANDLHKDNENKKQGNVNLGKVQKLLSLDMLTPEAYFHRLGEAGDYLFKEMRKAQDKSISIYNEAVKYGEKNLEGADFRKLEKEMHQVKLGGRQINLSTAQLMELYLLMGRDQAREHILNPSGGLKLRDVKKGAKVERHPDPIKNITEQEISDAMALLSPQQIAWADSMQKYVSGKLADHGNEASMRVYGYEKFLDDNYWKITSNEQDVRRDIGQTKGVITSVAGKGMAQPLTPKANTSIMLGSIFDTYSNSVMEMADYAAWLATMEDINRIRNYQQYEGEKGERHRVWTMQQTFDRVFGNGGAKYLETLMSHLANGVQSEQSFFGGFTGNYKAAVIGFNIRVVIQQPTAIFRAMDMISPKYLLSAMASKAMKGWKEAKKYSPIAVWKDWGFFDVGTGRQMKGILFKDSSALEKVKSAGMWLPGQADSVGWGWLWNAVKKEVKATTDLEGEAFYKRVAKRFNDIVDHTQVVDGVLQRSDIMRRSDSLTKMAVSFMAEPMKQYNMLVSAVYDSRHATGEKLTAAKKRIARASGALLIAGIINAVAQSIVDGLRNSDRDKDYWEKFLAALLGDPDDKKKSDFEKFIQSNFGDMLNVAGYIPFAKDILSLLEGYDVSRMDMDAISESIKSAQAIVKASNGEGKDSLGMAIVNACGSFGQLLGISFKNIKREALAVTSAIVHGTGSYVAEYHLLVAQKQINSTTKKEFIDLLIEAHDNDKRAYKYLYNEYIKNKGFATSKLSAMEYVNDKISKHEEAQTTAKNRTSAGLTKKDIARYEKALKAHDEDKNDKPNKDEIYYTLMEIDMSMKQKETLWAENGYTKDKKPQSLREYDAIMKKKK